MEYLLVILSTVLFGVQFGFTKKYQLIAGEGLKASFLYSAVSPVAFALLMFAIAKDRLEFVPFTVICSIIWAVLANTFAYFSMKSLAYGSVANYSVFILGGGMVLPVTYGFFTGDSISVPKVIGILLILVAIGVKLDLKEKGGMFAYLCFFTMFVLNGVIGILSAVHQGDLLPFDRSSSEQFSFMRSLFTAILGSILFGILSIKEKTDKELSGRFLKAIPWALSSGVINGIGNLLLLYALLKLDPSLQYPLLTGGTILVTSVIGLLFLKEKIDKKTLLSILFSIAGTIVVVL